jgi:spore coat protein H
MSSTKDMRSLRALPAMFALLVMSCQPDPLPDANFEPVDWTDATHSNDVAPNYDVVFDQAEVKAIRIRMTADDWAAIQNDMKARTGADFGTGLPNNPGGGLDAVPGDPEYVPLSVLFDGKEWYKVGFRLKGNSTLKGSWSRGIYKLPFRLHFDKFEDSYPQIDNQRFFGFKELSFSPGANDPSLIREKLGADLMHAAGVPACKTAFYQVYIDFGAGEMYCGIYTMVEVVDDTMLKRVFAEDDGNIYKPQSRLSFFNIQEFEKKNNEQVADYSDVMALISELNSAAASPDPVAWRARIEKIVDVDVFLRWLAANTTMVNWDSYGIMPHNYYLYNHSKKGITWIPWDHNEVLNEKRGGGIVSNAGILSMSLSEVSTNWPLIHYLVKDTLYRVRYRSYVEEFSTTVFTPEKMSALFDHHHGQVAPYVEGPLAVESGKYTHLGNLSNFTNSVAVLNQHVAQRKVAIEAFLE